MTVLEKNNMFNRVASVADLISKDIFEEAQNNGNEMHELLEFVKENGVPLTENQVEAMFLLNMMDDGTNGLNDIGLYANAVRPLLTPTKLYYDLVNKITLADRIKGTAKLGNILKAQVANPSNNIPSSELQPKAMKEKELNR